MGKTDVFYFEGLEDILIAMMSPGVQDGVNTPPTYEQIVRLPIATKLAVKGNGSALEKWASSKMFRRVSRETKHELGLDHVGIPVDVMDELKGLLAESGVTFSKNTAKEYPYFAFGFIGKVESGGRKAVWYPKTQLSNVIDEEYATEEDETKIDDVTANFVATGLNYNNVMYTSFDSNRTGSSLDLFDKFIAQPVYSEDQWKSIVATTAPKPPTSVTGSIKSDGSIEVNFDAVTGAKSYLIHYGNANVTDPHLATFMGYTETNTWTLSAADVPALTTGDKITLYVQTYEQLGVGATDVEKARYLHDGQFLGSAWSQKLELTK